MSKEKLGNLLHSLVQDYFAIQSLEDSCKEFAEMKVPDSLAPDAVYFILNECVEAKEKEQSLVGKLLVGLHEKQLLSENNLAGGFNHLVENIDDLIIDIPSIDATLSAFLVTLITTGKVSPAVLKGISSLSAENNTGKILAKTLKGLSTTLGEEGCKTLLGQVGGVTAISSGVNSKWLGDNGLGFLSS